MSVKNKADAKAALDLMFAVAEAIREAGEVPSGHLYAVLMTKGLSIQHYEGLIRSLKGAGLVLETPAKLLKWTGPLKGVRSPETVARERAEAAYRVAANVFYGDSK